MFGTRHRTSRPIEPRSGSNRRSARRTERIPALWLPTLIGCSARSTERVRYETPNISSDEAQIRPKTGDRRAAPNTFQPCVSHTYRMFGAQHRTCSVRDTEHIVRWGPDPPQTGDRRAAPNTFQPCVSYTYRTFGAPHRTRSVRDTERFGLEWMFGKERRTFFALFLLGFPSHCSRLSARRSSQFTARRKYS